MPTLSPARLANQHPLVFAHRGGRALGPENTLPAFDAGMAAGADGLELDVHLSADGSVVVIHDATLERTSDANGPVAALAADQLARVNATRRFGIELEHTWTGRVEGLPTLSEVLQRYGDIPVIIEMKGERVELGPAVVACVKGAGATDRVCLGSFNAGLVTAARRAGPEIPTSAAREEARWALHRSWIGWSPGSRIESLCLPGPRARRPPAGRLTPLHQGGAPRQLRGPGLDGQ